MGAIYYSGKLTDALNAFNDKPKWIIEPYIPAEGTVLLHGKFSLGKSPLIWRVAQCVSEGLDFFGLPIQQTGPVIYVEIDEPLRLTVERLKVLTPSPRNVTVVGINPFSILNLLPDDHARLTALNETIHPLLVIVNTLRKAHHLDDKDSATPSLVYGAFRRYFPEAAFLFVHHDRKSSQLDGESTEPGDEDFSGSQAWMNDAQIGLHLIPAGNGRRTGLVDLQMTKSQLSALQDPLRLRLAPDGVNWVDVGSVAIQKAYALQDSALPKMRRYELLVEAFHLSEKTIRRALEGHG